MTLFKNKSMKPGEDEGEEPENPISINPHQPGIVKNYLNVFFNGVSIGSQTATLQEQSKVMISLFRDPNILKYLTSEKKKEQVKEKENETQTYTG